MRCTLLSLLSLWGFHALAQPLPLYRNSSAPVEERVRDLLGRMTPEEKFWQLFMIPSGMEADREQRYRHGIFGFQVSDPLPSGDPFTQRVMTAANSDARALASRINGIQQAVVEHSRLGIPVIAFDEALHGLVRTGATAFPQAIALAATWDTELMGRVATAIATETRLRGIRQVLSPVVNLASDVRWGRTEETYGEDPWLSTEMGLAFTGPFERMGVLTTPKHFVANVGDGGRDSWPIHFSDRYLEESHFLPFRALVDRGGVGSIMTAYNSVDGRPASAHGRLLLDKLKGEWGFQGFVISDAGAVGGALVLHGTAADYPGSGEQAIQNGLDVIFQTAYEHHTLFLPPFLDGRIARERLDDAVSRVLRAKFRLGLFEDPLVRLEDIDTIDTERHRQLAREAAAGSFVLLKNDGGLPLRRKVGTLAVIGPDAAEVRLGGYSGPGIRKESILDAIRAKMPHTKVLYQEGPGLGSDAFLPVPAEFLDIRGAYFQGSELVGPPVLERDDASIDYHWTFLGPNDSLLRKDHFSVRWTGTLTAPFGGTIHLGVQGDDGYRLYLDGQLLIDRWEKVSFHTDLLPVTMEEGKRHRIVLEYRETDANATVRLVWDHGTDKDAPKRLKDAVTLAQEAEEIVVVAGIREGEFQDRALLTVPGAQEDLILKLAATGKPVHVLLVGGSAVVMERWIDKVRSVTMIWYPGEAGGPAVADMLWGDVNPSGKLPITFPMHEAQLPLGYRHLPTGRGDDYIDLSGAPRFPFGHGLSYTRFGYSDLILANPKAFPGDTVSVTCSVTNLGAMAGAEVVQLYLRDEMASVARPLLELKGFRKIHLEPGASAEVRFLLTPDMFSLLDPSGKRVVEKGRFRIMVGPSSRELPLKADLELR